MDYSFLKFYDSITESLNDTEFKDAGLTYFLSIQLSPSETYLQTTNYEGGLSFGGNFEAYIVDNCDNSLKDITANVFIEEFNNADGDVQNKIEIVSIGEDFFGRAVFIKLYHPVSGLSYYTRPVLITDNNLQKTFRFDYTNNQNLLGISYENALCTQSIRLMFKFSGFNNNSNVGGYYQISTANTISTRLLKQISNSYIAERIDTYTFDRLQKLFEHDTIYIDNVRLTTNPILEAGERMGQTNLFSANFEAYINKSDTFTFAYQIFSGSSILGFTPTGSFVTGTTITEYGIDFSSVVEIGTGTVKVYDLSDDSLLVTYTQDDFTVVSNTTIRASSSGSAGENPPNGTYYVHVTEGLVTALGSPNEAITDNSTWTFNLKDSDFDATDFNSDDFLT